MAEEPKKEHKLPSMLEMSEMLDRVRSQMHPLSYNFEKLNIIQGIASQYEHLNPAISIEEIARKTFEQQNLASVNLIASSVSAGLAQPQIREAIALQDSFRKIAEGLSVNNNVMLAAESATQGVDRNNVYKDAMASFSQFRKSLKPLRDSLNTAGNAFNGSEFANLVKELQTSRVIPESTLSEYSGIFKQFESLHNLESFKAISRLKNFPKDDIWQQDYSEVHEITESSIVEARKIDAEISEEILSVNDFNDLSEETQNSLKQVFSEHYEYFIMKIIVSLCLLQENLNKDLDLSNKSFIFVNSLEGSIFFIGSYWNQNKAAIINGLITTAIYNALIWLFFMK